MKAYLAHNYSALSYLRDEIKPKLENLGIEVTSRWLNGTHDGGEKSTELQRHLFAFEDLADVSRSDLLIYFANRFNNNPGTGKHIELGFALGLNKQIAVIGEEKELVSVFHWLNSNGLRRYTNFYALYVELSTARIFKVL